MVENIKVSIIVPVYNAEQYLHRTIQALIDQTLQEIEILLIDDGSTDHSPDICDNYAAANSRIICIHKINQGVSEARNTGIKAARGEYLMFCDADDIPDRNQAKLLYERAKTEKADAVLCGFTKQTAGEIIPEYFPYTESMCNQADIIEKLVMPMCVWGYSPNISIYGSVWRGLYCNQLLTSNQISFDSALSLGEDMVFNICFLLACKKISFVPEPLYVYFENMNSATHSHPEQMWEKYLSTWQAVHKIMKEFPCSSSQIQWHNYQLTRYAVNAIIEGVCVLNVSQQEKSRIIKRMLSEQSLLRAINDIPVKLSFKNKILIKMLNPKFSKVVLKYYQRRGI